jgi:hypothetical protein
MAFDATVGADTQNAYILVATATSHHADRGNDAWTEFTAVEHQQGIIRASDFIDKRFGRRFRGLRRTKEQGLEWPRLDAFDDDGFLMTSVDQIPRQIQKACAEYALRALLCGVLSPDPLFPVPKQDLTDSTATRETDSITGEVTRKRDRVGPLEEERWYETRSQTIGRNLAAGATSVKSGLVNDFIIPEYPEADMWIEELLRSPSMRLSRGD